MKRTQKRRSAVTRQPGRKAAHVNPVKEHRSGSRKELWIYLLLFGATFLLYLQTATFEFVDFDDPDYSGRAQSFGGLTKAGLRWAFTSGEASNWFPVTRISHLIDAQLFGAQSGMHHLTSVFFHALATVLFFSFLARATGARWRPLLVALLFAVHPLHVESVAWVAERKDVLCAFFWFLTLWLYVRYAASPKIGRYAVTLASFCLGLMSKPMIVTLPIILVALDVWPLGRLRDLGVSSGEVRPVSLGRAAWEKVPFLVLSAIVSVITYVTQKTSGSVEVLHLAFRVRVENALVSYVTYVFKTIWPTRLALLYPYPDHTPAWQAVLAATTLLGLTVLAFRHWGAHPYAAVGWFWYLVSMLPVIGLIQVGIQSRADRYMYIPMTGLLLIGAWGLSSCVQRWPGFKRPAIVIAAATCLCAGAATTRQLQYWKSSEALYSHAVAVTDRNYTVQYGLGVVLAKEPGRLEDAIAHYQEAIRIRPEYVQARANLGVALSEIPGRLPEAVAQYQTALRLKPDSAELHNDLGAALAKIPGRTQDAITEYQAAIRLKPDFFEAHNNLANLLSTLPGRSADVIAEYQAALRINNDAAATHKKLAAVLVKMPGRLTNAIAEYQAALRLEPESVEARAGLADALVQIAGKLPDAIAQYQAAIRIKPDSPELHNNLANLLEKDPGRVAEAVNEYEIAVRLKPNFFEAQVNLGLLLSKIPGRTQEAAAHFEEALKIRPDPRVRTALEQLPATAK